MMQQKFISIGLVCIISFNLYFTLGASDKTQYLMLSNIESLAENEVDEKNIKDHVLKRQLCPDGKSYNYICSYTNKPNNYCDSREITECPEEEEEEIYDDEIIWDDEEEDYGVCPVTEGEHWWKTDSENTYCVCCGYIQGYI